MKRIRFALIGVLLLTVLGCTSVEFAKTTQNSYRPKAATCSFDIVMTRPERKFVELGILEELRCAGPCKKVSDVRTLVQPHVCRVGGDAVIFAANGYGWYVKGIVIKYLH